MSKRINKSINQCYYFPQSVSAWITTSVVERQEGTGCQRRKVKLGWWVPKGMTITLPGLASNAPELDAKTRPSSEFRFQRIKVKCGMPPFPSPRDRASPAEILQWLGVQSWGKDNWVFRSCPEEKASLSREPCPSQSFRSVPLGMLWLHFFSLLETCWAFSPPLADLR